MNEWVNECVDRATANLPGCESGHGVRLLFFFSLREGFGGLRVWVLGVAFVLLWSGISSMVGVVGYFMLWRDCGGRVLPPGQGGVLARGTHSRLQSGPRTGTGTCSL